MRVTCPLSSERGTLKKASGEACLVIWDGQHSGTWVSTSLLTVIPDAEPSAKEDPGPLRYGPGNGKN